MRKLHGPDYDGEDIEDLLDEIEWIDVYDQLPIIWKSEDYDEEDDDEEAEYGF